MRCNALVRWCCLLDIDRRIRTLLQHFRGSVHFWKPLGTRTSIDSIIGQLNHQPNHPFYGHYTGQRALTSTSSWRILLVQSFTARMPLLMANSTFGLVRDAGVLNSVIYTVSVPPNRTVNQKCRIQLSRCFTWIT